MEPIFKDRGSINQYSLSLYMSKIVPQKIIAQACQFWREYVEHD